MAKQVFLHIGPPKTGTTFVQQILWTNTAELKKAEIVLPFKNAWCHRFVSKTLRGVPRWTNRGDSEKWNWNRFVDRVHSTRHSVLLSAEDLASASRAEVARAVESLSPATVHVIATARDLGRQIPSAWQNSVEKGHVQTLDDYVRWAMDERSAFWKSQDLPGVLGRWLEHVPKHRVHLVMVPGREASAGLLWTRFAGVIGVDAQAVQLPETMSNVSLGAVPTEVLRKLYAGLGNDHAERVAYYKAVRTELFSVLSGNGERARAVRVPTEYRQRVVERGQQMVQELQRLGVDVRGDWDDLVADGSTAADESVSPEQQLEVALQALRGIVVRAELLGREHDG